MVNSSSSSSLKFVELAQGFRNTALETYFESRGWRFRINKIIDCRDAGMKHIDTAGNHKSFFTCYPG